MRVRMAVMVMEASTTAGPLPLPFPLPGTPPPHPTSLFVLFPKCRHLLLRHLSPQSIASSPRAGAKAVFSLLPPPQVSTVPGT